MTDDPNTPPSGPLDADTADEQHRDTGCRQPEHCLGGKCACRA